MKRFTCNFSLTPKVDASGKVTVKSDNIAMGLVVCLVGFLFAGIFIAMVVGFCDPATWYDLRREPFDIDTRKLAREIEEHNQRMLEVDPNAEPLPSLPVIVRHDPGGFDWAAFGRLVVIHAFILAGVVAGFVGLRIMFTGTKVIFDPGEGRAEWHHTGFWRASTHQYALSELTLVLRETVIRNPRGFDWHGYAASLVTKDNTALQVARRKNGNALREYAGDIRRLTGIEVKEMAPEPESGDAED
jgi:hypothetical protein